MSSTIIIKNSSTPGGSPSSLTQGEIAINVTDGKLFYGSGSANTVKELSTGGGGTVNTSSLLTTASFNAYTGSNTSQFAGTASYAITSSYALVAQTLLGSVESASYALTASYAATASFVTASNVYGPFGSNSILSASYANYASTASSALNAEDILVYVKNVSGVQINKGTVVRISGATGDNPLISTASYEADGLSANTLGITNQNIPNDSFGYVMTEGRLLGINTDSFSAGQLLYLGPTGSIIGTAPLAPLHSVRIGEVLRVQTNNGSMYVRIDNGYELGELHDVVDNTTTSSYGDLLVKSGSVWTNSRQLTGSYGLTGSLNATSFTGSLFGTSSWARNAVSASNITVTNDSSTNATHYLTFSPSSSGAIGAKIDSNFLTYNPSTKLLTAGDLTLTAGGPRTLTIQATGAGGTEIKLLPNSTGGHARINVGNTTQPLDFQMNSNDVMRIAQDGKVGIGTTGATAKLEVRGTGIDSSTTAFLIKNASLSDLLKIGDGGGIAHGNGVIADGSYSHAEGLSALASAPYSHAEGFGTVASGSYQHVQGQYNISSSAQSAFIIGNGTGAGARSNLVFASGSTFQVTGSVIATQGFTGSLFGTSSFATTSSYALNGGVTQIVAGTNVTISPTNGLGAVTINSTGGGGGTDLGLVQAMTLGLQNIF